MTIEYDDKGKFYTDIVKKVPMPVVIQTVSHLVRGLVHVRDGERLKNELERAEIFLAVTHAAVLGALSREEKRHAVPLTRTPAAQLRTGGLRVSRVARQAGGHHLAIGAHQRQSLRQARTPRVRSVADRGELVGRAGRDALGVGGRQAAKALGRVR